MTKTYSASAAGAEGVPRATDRSKGWGNTTMYELRTRGLSGFCRSEGPAFFSEHNSILETDGLFGLWGQEVANPSLTKSI